MLQMPTSCEWLRERQRPGNWIDVAETDEIPSEIEGWNVTVIHMFQIAFAPEIRRRSVVGMLDDGFFLTAAQMIQPEDGTQIIRLNEEVRGTALIRANRTIQKEDPIFVSDMQNFVGFDLDEEELDAGHFTLFWTGNGWAFTFDFRRGRAKVSAMLVAAKQFLEVSKLALSHGYTRPSVDTLFSACELLSKAHLILRHNSASRAKSHGPIQSAINAWGRLGNINGEFVHLFNRVSNTRYPARYEVKAEIAMPTSSDLKLVEDEIEQLTQFVTHRVGTDH
ncbi:MAG: HEPN domain-containing protein [Rhodospirillales bacterium]|nr:HEPN domain-containing protein [Rhodospirillales bacterium]